MDINNMNKYDKRIVVIGGGVAGAHVQLTKVSR
jgi:glycerol-3-phosphate dehydrogenase